MKIPRWTLRSAVVAAALFGAATGLAAQGVTTGAISGTVTNAQGQALEGAQIQVTNRNTGARAGALTRGDGRYFVSSLETGGPYTVSVRRIGYAPRDSNGVYIALGQNQRIDFVVSQQAAQLEGVQIVSTTPSSVIGTSHKGVSTTVTDSAISRLPTFNRNFTDFVVLTPQLSTSGPGNSGGGQNNRFNAIQIDGSVASDLFGLGSTGQPGAQAGAKQISLEAIKEYQVLLSPYDIRQGNFTGFMLNAVTKAGSNEFHGSGTYATRNEKLERDVDYLRASPFSQKQEGFWIGGPIMRDKIFFSVAPEFQQQQAPASGPFVGAGTPQPSPVAQADVDRLVSILQTKYGYTDPGGAGKIENENPLKNMFVRLDFVNLPMNSRLVTRWNYVDAQQDIFSRSTTTFGLSNNGYNFRSVTNSGLAQLFSNFANGNSNELLFGYTTVRDKRITPVTGPFVRITRVPNPNGGNTAVQAGTENSSQGNELDQDVLELTDNITVPWKTHRFTVGTKNEFLKVRNLFAQNSFGNFTFGTLDSLQNNTPSSATLGINLDKLNGLATDGAARFHARTLGFYAEDEWQATNNLNINVGLRLDIPGLTDSPSSNPTVLANLKDPVSGNPINTSNVPRNVKQWSPRIGFNWDVTGDQRNQLRGGSGVFVGRPAYVWLSNLFGNSGVNGFANLACNSAALAPAMPNAGQPIPTNCRGSTAAPAVTANTVDPDLKFPGVWRSTLGFDRRLPWNVVGTIEGMYTRSLNNFYYQNINIVSTPIGTDRNGRTLYGDITSATSNLVPVRRTTALGDVIHMSNSTTADYSYNLTGILQKRFTNAFEGSASYSYGRSYSIWDLTSSVAFSNWSFGRSYSGRQDAQELRPSKWDAPHRLVFAGTYSLPTKTDISFTAFGESGVPFEYINGNDMNGDNSTANDPVYVPKDARNPAEIQFSVNGNLTSAMQADSLENFIATHECLNSQRGTVMLRNSCRTPWTKRVNISARQSLPTLHGQNFIVQLDVFNFLNLLNKNWGAQDLGSSNSPTLLTRRTWVQPTAGQPLKLASGAQGVFNFTPFNQFNTRNASSNYALQLQLKYTF